jgi:hypothetical protein
MNSQKKRNRPASPQSNTTLAVRLRRKPTLPCRLSYAHNSKSVKFRRKKRDKLELPNPPLEFSRMVLEWLEEEDYL